jgi:hypothetical protein
MSHVASPIPQGAQAHRFERSTLCSGHNICWKSLPSSVRTCLWLPCHDGSRFNRTIVCPGTMRSFAQHTSSSRLRALFESWGIYTGNSETKRPWTCTLETAWWICPHGCLYGLIREREGDYGQTMTTSTIWQSADKEDIFRRLRRTVYSFASGVAT